MLSRLYTFAPGTTIQSAQINAEFNQIVQLLSGTKLDATLLKASSTSDPTLTVDNTGGGKPQEWRIAGTAKLRVNETGQLESLLATGTAPLVVASTTKVANLNADLLDGKDLVDLLLSTAPSVKESGGDSRLIMEQASANLRLVNDATGFKIVHATSGDPLLAIDKATKVVTVYGVLKGITPVAAADLVRKDYADAIATAAGAAAVLASNTVSGITGGTDGKVVRWSSGTTWTDASRADNPFYLEFVLFKQGGSYYLPGSVVSGLSGLFAGSPYFLSTGGDISLSAPDPASGVTQKLIGYGLDATRLLFYPQRPISWGG